MDVEFECTQSTYTKTGEPHNAVAIQSKCAKEGPAIFQHRTYIRISVLDNIFVRWKCSGDTKEPVCMLQETA